MNLFLDLTKILKESRDEGELRHAWKEWHDKSGNPIRESYVRFVELANEVARLNGNKITLPYQIQNRKCSWKFNLSPSVFWSRSFR